MILPICTGLASTARAEPVETADTYEIVVDLAVSTLPPELEPFFEAQRETLRTGAKDAVFDTEPPQSDLSGFARHFVWLDVATDGDDWEARRAAAKRFPQDRAGAERMFTKAEVATGGVLPWVIESGYRELVGAFRADDGKRLVGSTGTLLHFAADAAQPYNTTTFGHPAGAHGGHENAPYEFQVVLAERLSRRLAYEARVWPQRCAPRADILALIFETLLDAHADAALLADVHAAGRPVAHGQSAEHDSLSERAAPILEARLEAGALLGANLIVSAWVEAGRPELPDVAVRGRADDGVDDLSIEEHAFVGSRNSTIVHRVTCAHARRIKPENRVYFDSTSAAKAVGRTDCKACDPYDPAD